MLLTDIRTQNIDAEAQAMLTPLQKALLKTGIKILHKQDVNKYKMQKLLSEQTSYARTRRFGYPMGILGIALIFDFPLAKGAILQISMVLAGILLAAKALALAVRPVSNIQWRTYCVGCCVARGLRIEPSFKANGLAERTCIPAEALSLASSIASTGVVANFAVEQLDDDPFFIVSDASPASDHYKEEAYYIYAWDEAGFKS